MTKALHDIMNFHHITMIQGWINHGDISHEKIQPCSSPAALPDQDSTLTPGSQGIPNGVMAYTQKKTMEVMKDPTIF